MFYIIASGKKKSKVGANSLDQVKQILDEKKIAYQVFVSEYASHAIKLAKECSNKEDCEAIIAVGGDGTFFEVLNGLNTSKPIGFVPAGTGNDFARTLGISTDPKECIDNILNNEPKYLDYIKIGNYRSFNVVGSGFDIDLLERENELRKKYDTKASYDVALIQTLFHFKFYKIKYRLDDEKEFHEDDAFIFEICNGKWGGGMLPIALDAKVDDGYLDFMYIPKFFKPAVLFLLLKFQSGKLTNTKYMKTIRCKKIEIDIEPKMKTNLDGEFFDLFPLTAEVVHNELKYFPSTKGPKDPYYILKHKKTEN